MKELQFLEDWDFGSLKKKKKVPDCNNFINMICLIVMTLLAKDHDDFTNKAAVLLF